MGARGPLLGVDPTRRDTSDEFGVGKTREVDGVTYMYVQANGAIATQLPVEVSDGFQAAACSSGDEVEGVSTAAFADNEYGWIAVRGEVTVNVAGSTAAGAALTPVADSNGDMVTVASAVNARRGKALTAESGGLSSVFLY